MGGGSQVLADVAPGAGFRSEGPRVLFDRGMPEFSFLWPHSFDVFPDGDRLVIVELAEQQRAPRILLVTNWFDELRGVLGN